MKAKKLKPLMFTDMREHAAGPAADLAPEADGEAVAVSQPPATPKPRKAAFQKPIAMRAPLDWTRHAYLIAAVAAVIWAGSLMAFVAGFQTHFGAFDYAPLHWVVLGLLAGLPAIFMILAAFALRQGAHLAGETRRARAIADDLMLPAALASDQVVGVAEAVRREVERVAGAAAQAHQQLSSLRQALAEENQRLAAAATEAERVARVLGQTLGQERKEMGELSARLETQTAGIGETIARQSRMVADASDVAQAQLDQAQTVLAARAADLTLAAGEVGRAAEQTGAQLTRQTERLETAGDTLSDRIARLHVNLSTERDALERLAASMRADHEDMAVQSESYRAQLIETATQARTGAEEIAGASTAATESFRTLVAEAAARMRGLAETAEREQAALALRARDALGALSSAAADERHNLESQTIAALDQIASVAGETRLAATEGLGGAMDAAAVRAQRFRAEVDQIGEAARVQIELVSLTARQQVEQLGEAAFEAASQADQAFETRLGAARRLIGQSAGLVEEAGQRSTERIEAGVAATRLILTDLERLLAEIDQRVKNLPEEAQARAESVRAAVERGVGDLTAAARQAAEETQAIDAAFHDRVRRNYKVLSEAVSLMGKVAAAEGPEPVAHAAPVAVPQSLAARPAAAVPEVEIAARAAEDLRAAALAEPRIAAAGGGVSFSYATAPAASARPPSSAAAAGLRPRLKLTPTPADRSTKTMFESGSAARRNGLREQLPAEALRGSDEADEWTWKDLLSSIEEAPVDDESLAEQLIAEIEALGVDAGALLPRARIDEIAAALQTGDAIGAREVVRRLAPAAVRRLSRRVLTDKVLRVQAARYVRRYEDLISDSAKKDRQGFLTAALLGSEPGRAFLLLDAAVGDLH